MAEPFLSEIRLFSFVFAPKGWALCNGQLLPINQNQPLFALLGTTYGGDGRVNFALPDLRARVPIHTGSGHTLGEKGGEQAHTLSVSEMPTHIHFVSAFAGAVDNNSTSGAGGYWGKTADATTLYFSGAADSAMSATTIGDNGGSQAHQNMQPFLTISFCIALQGIFPSPN